MNLVTLDGVRKQYSERLLLDNVSLLVNRGDRIGLIGLNGSGKTTLLRIIAGLEVADAGNVTVWGGVRVRFLSQEPALDDRLTVLDTLFHSDAPQMRLVRDYEAASHALQQHPADPKARVRFDELAAEMDRTAGWQAEAEAKAILTRLGVGDFDATVSTLSGGQRKRVALARVLLDCGDLLILDEPTNHVDADTVDWLEQHLVALPAALLMVTHDRYFLDRVVNRIVELDRRQLVSYPGNYTRYLELSAERHERLAELEEDQRRLLRRELEWLRRSPGARATKQKARKQRVDELLTLRYDSRQDRVTMALASRRLGKKVLTAQGLAKSYDDQVVFRDVGLELAPGDRLGIIGPNGAGKSTLLDILAGRIQPDAGGVEWGDTVHLGYYDQRNADLGELTKVIDFVKAEAPLIRTAEGERIEAAQMLEWFLFPRPQQQARIAALSGGERRRLYMLRTLIHQPNVLLLDEPTNDLDIQTLAVLEEFLDHFKGCLIVASHDRYFLDRTVDYLLVMDKGGLSGRYPTPFSAYQTLRDQQDRAADSPPTSRPISSRSAAANTSGLRRLSWKEERELENLEKQIHDLERHKQALEDEISANSNDYLVLNEATRRLQLVEVELDTAMMRWFELVDRSTAS